jgi:hypothetical protein
MEIMNFEHPHWLIFIQMIGDEILENDCSGKITKEHARKVLTEMGNIDIEKTFEFLEENGARCDCMVMYDVIAPNEKKPLLAPLIDGLIKGEIPFTKKMKTYQEAIEEINGMIVNSELLILKNLAYDQDQLLKEIYAITNSDFNENETPNPLIEILINLQLCPENKKFRIGRHCSFCKKPDDILRKCWFDYVEFKTKEV